MLSSWVLKKMNESIITWIITTKKKQIKMIVLSLNSRGLSWTKPLSICNLLIILILSPIYSKQNLNAKKFDKKINVLIVEHKLPITYNNNNSIQYNIYDFSPILSRQSKPIKSNNTKVHYILGIKKKEKRIAQVLKENTTTIQIQQQDSNYVNQRKFFKQLGKNEVNYYDNKSNVFKRNCKYQLLCWKEPLFLSGALLDSLKIELGMAENNNT